MSRKLNAYYLVISVISILVSVMGCGGGGSSTTIKSVSGVAAAGTPLAGFAYLKDSAGVVKGPVLIGSDGSFSFDTTGLKPPFYLEADGVAGGEGFKIHSVTTSAPIANINPLSNVAVAVAAGVSDPASAYNNPSQYPITPSNLKAAIAEIRAMLQPLLDAYDANVDPVTDTYTANHTGLDGVFDVVQVSLETTNGGITITDKTTGTQIASATTTTLTNPSKSVAAADVPSKQTLTDLQAIAAQLSALATVISNKGKNISAQDLDPFFATNFGVADGYTRDEIISSWVGTLIITSITDLTIKEKIGNDYLIHFAINFSDGSSVSRIRHFVEGFTMTFEDGTWKIKGNGKNSYLFPVSLTMRTINPDGSNSLTRGLEFNPADPGSVGLNYAVVTGPGLPAAGISFSKVSCEPPWLCLDSHTSPIPDTYLIDDISIQTIPDNAEYTVKFYSDGIYTNLLETRKAVIPRRPFLSTEADDTYFPTILDPTSHSILTIASGKTITISYKLPTAFQTISADLAVVVWDNSSDNISHSVPILLNESSVTVTDLTYDFTPTGGYLDIGVVDLWGRNTSIHWEYSDK